MKSVLSTVALLLTCLVISQVQGEYKKFQHKILSSPAVDIQSIDVTPMPIYNPGEASLTFAANLKRPISE